MTPTPTHTYTQRESKGERNNETIRDGAALMDDIEQCGLSSVQGFVPNVVFRRLYSAVFFTNAELFLLF